MKEYILSALYEILMPWSCDASEHFAYVHPANVKLAREHLKAKGFGDIVVIGRGKLIL